MFDPNLQYLAKADLLVHQAISLTDDRDEAAALLFDAAMKALSLDMPAELAINVVQHWAGALKVQR